MEAGMAAVAKAVEVDPSVVVVVGVVEESAESAVAGFDVDDSVVGIVELRVDSPFVVFVVIVAIAEVWAGALFAVMACPTQMPVVDFTAEDTVS
ncbi:hypothetical protein TSMEX_004946 [Taenia solium]|eukprot:TsM_000633700 transcript=TsM_000633700 gene=TsM_000633700